MSAGDYIHVTNLPIAKRLKLNAWLNVNLLVLVVFAGVYSNYIYTGHDAKLDELYMQQSVIYDMNELVISNMLLAYGALYDNLDSTIPELLAKSEDMHAQFSLYQDMAYDSGNITDTSFAQEYESVVFSLRSAIVKSIVLYRQGKYTEAKEYFKKVVKTRSSILQSVIETSLYTKKLEIEETTISLRSLQKKILLAFIAAFVIVISLVTIINLRLKETIHRPLTELMRATDEISSGNLNYKTRINSEDEFGQLGNSFNKMAGNLDNALIELRTNNQELEAKNAELERFTYTASHDLKSPLITIRGFIGLLEKDAASCNAERVAQDIEQIKQATEHMQSLLEDLLALSRVGRVVNALESVDLNELVQQAQQHVSGAIIAGDVDVVVIDNLPTVFGDPVRLREVIQNLLENAVKFASPDGQSRVDISAWQDENETGCCVKDNGVGIDPRYHEKIFGLFERLDNETEGTGIGLALVKRIVEVHGGRIWVESEGVGHGSCFCFVLPKTS